MLVLDKGSKRIKNKFWNFLFVRKQNVWVSQFQVNKVNGCQRKSNEQNGSKNGKPEFNAEKKTRKIIRIDLLENNPDNLSNKYYFVILSLSSSWVMNEI
jgi:hypothetical protein